MTLWELKNATLTTAQGREIELSDYLVQYDAGMLAIQPKETEGTHYFFPDGGIAFITKGPVDLNGSGALTIYLADRRTLSFPKSGFKLTEVGRFYVIAGDGSWAIVSRDIFYYIESHSKPQERPSMEAWSGGQSEAAQTT